MSDTIQGENGSTYIEIGYLHMANNNTKRAIERAEYAEAAIERSIKAAEEDREELTRLHARAEKAEAQASKLRKAMEDCEWSGGMPSSCPQCNGYRKHQPRCIVGIALGRPECAALEAK